MTSKMANDSGSSSNKEQNYNGVDQNNNTTIGISDDLNKLKTSCSFKDVSNRPALFVKPISW